jgi:hypothetical protein
MSQPPPPEKMHFIRMDEGTDEAFKSSSGSTSAPFNTVRAPVIGAARRPRPGHRLQHHATRSLPGSIVEKFPRKDEDSEGA